MYIKHEIRTEKIGAIEVKFERCHQERFFDKPCYTEVSINNESILWIHWEDIDEVLGMINSADVEIIKYSLRFYEIKGIE